MLDVIGYIKVDESKPQRVDYLFACIKSWEFAKDDINFVLAFEDASHELFLRVSEAMEAFPSCRLFNYSHYAPHHYGKVFSELLKHESKHNFICNFFEDHFMLLDEPEKLKAILLWMKFAQADICKASFFRIEQNSISAIRYDNVSALGMAYLNNSKNHAEYQKHYGSRYYIGVNFITTKDFALKFWYRELGARPHGYEVSEYKREWEHTCMVPNIELQCAIDDDHGEEGTCLLKRNEPKWKGIYEEVKNKFNGE